jgi:hypothetical protein
MPVRAALLGLLLASLSVRGAEVSTIKGETLKGDVLSLTDKQVVLNQDGTRITKPMDEVLKIDFRAVGAPPAGTTYAAVELTDGTVLACRQWLIKGKQAELTLLAGPTVKVPLGVLASVLNNAQLEKNRKDWKDRVRSKRGREVVVVLNKEGTPQNIDCTLGEGDATGESISFAITIGTETEERTRKLASLHGLIFKNKLPPKAAPVVCKVLDTHQDVVMVSKFTLKDASVVTQTPAGAKLTLGLEAVAQLDFSKGKLEYLSDLDPETAVISSNAEDEDKPQQQHIYKDVSMSKDRLPLTLGGVIYKKGLALRPHTELVYDLKGDFREFSAVVGLDDNVGATGTTLLVVEADGKELTALKFTAGAKVKHRQVTLNVKDVQKLKVVVKSGELLDLGKHLDLADAKVSK